MSILQFELYVQNILKLSKSMIIKHHPTAILQNEEIKRSQAITGVGVDEDDLSSWKYYMNLAGLYHPLDEPMTVVSLDTTEPILFNRDNILRHRATFKEYQFGSQYYDELVKRYPKQEDLIRGILDPIEIDRAISSPDYTILYYDENELEPNETNIIPLLQDQLYAEIDRWEVRDYGISDEYYPLALLSLVYLHIPQWISVLRIENCKTYKAHSFHIWNYLDGFGNLSQYKDYLTRRQVLWLYRNIAWVRNNAGKEETFLALVENLCTVRGIPIGKYSVRHNTEEMPDALLPAVDAVRYPINLLDKLEPEPTINTVRYIMEKSLSLAKDNPEYFEADLKAAETIIPRGEVSEMPIKFYESEMFDTTDSESFKLADVLVNHWLLWSATGRYNSVINVPNPYTNEVMTMSVKDAFIVWIYAKYKREGIELGGIPDLNTQDTLRSPLPSLSTLRAMSEAQHITDEEIAAKYDLQPVIGSIISTEVFNDQCHEIHRVMLELEYQWINQMNASARANHELVSRAFYADVGIRLHPENKTYLEYFTEQGWRIADLSNMDLDILMKSIYELALGIDVSNVKSLRDIQEAMLKLMAQLGTYDTQYIQSINSSPSVPLDWNAPMLEEIDHYVTQYIGPDPEDGIELSMATQGSIRVIDDLPAIENTHTTDHNIVVLAEIGVNSDVIVTRNKSFEFLGAEIGLDVQGMYNLDDLIVDGTVLDPIITPNLLEDLKDHVRNKDLDGLDYPEE